MGTRGLYGFRKKGKDKITYNHWDSYPSYLGKNVVDFIKKHTIEELNTMYDNIILVKESDTPTIEQLDECRKYINLEVGSQSFGDWYCVLRDAQGDLNAYANGLKYMIDSRDFILDSCFCEYAYIINLDTNKLEFWVGFQSTPDKNNRYGFQDDGGYFPCKLMNEFDLQNLNTVETDEVVKSMEGNARTEFAANFGEEDLPF